MLCLFVCFFGCRWNCCCKCRSLSTKSFEYHKRNGMCLCFAFFCYCQNEWSVATNVIYISFNTIQIIHWRRYSNAIQMTQHFFMKYILLTDFAIVETKEKMKREQKKIKWAPKIFADIWIWQLYWNFLCSYIIFFDKKKSHYFFSLLFSDFPFDSCHS